MMNNNRQIIMDKANQNQRKYDQSRTKTYNKGRNKEIEYQVGDVVLNNIQRKMIGNKAKLTPSWTGPFEIIEIINDKTYKIRDIETENEEIQNLRFSKPYKVTPYINMMNHAMMMMNKQDKHDKEYDKIVKYTQEKMESL